MFVRDWMTADLVVATPQTSVLDARRLLARHAIHHLPVLDGERLVGIVSDRDLRVGNGALAAAPASPQPDLAGGGSPPIEAIMSHPAHTISSSATLAAATKLMLDYGISALLVVDDGRVVGILTTSDCMRAVCTCLQTPPGESPAATQPARSQAPMMPVGDDQPGQPAARPQALVINADNYDRVQIARQLESAGYKVTTCPGPMAGVLCPAMLDPDGPVCLRLPSDLDLVVVDPDSANPGLLTAYRRWAPRAELHIQER